MSNLLSKATISDIKRNIKKKTITRNKWGRFEDPQTHIVFDPVSKKAYGYQDHESGSVRSLSNVDKRICEKKGWAFVDIPVKDDDDSDEEDDYTDDEESD